MPKTFIIFLIFFVSCSSLRPPEGSERAPASLSMGKKIYADLLQVLKKSKGVRKSTSREDQLINLVENINHNWRQNFGNPKDPFFGALPLGPTNKWQSKIIEISLDADVIDETLEALLVCTIWRHENLKRTLKNDIQAYRSKLPKHTRYTEGGADYVLEEGDNILGRSFHFRLKHLTERDLKLILDTFSDQEVQVLRNAF